MKKKYKKKSKIKYEDFGLKTGDTLCLSEEITNKTSLYRTSLNTLPYLIGTLSSKLNPFSKLAGIIISLSTVNISKNVSKRIIKTIIDNYDDKKNGTLTIEKDGEEIKIPVDSILQASKIAQADYVLLGRMIQGIVDYEKEYNEKQKNKYKPNKTNQEIIESPNKNNIHNEHFCIPTDTVKRPIQERDKEKVFQITQDQIKKLESAYGKSELLGTLGLIPTIVFKGFGLNPTSNAISNTFIYQLSKKFPKLFAKYRLKTSVEHEKDENNKLSAETDVELAQLTKIYRKSKSDNKNSDKELYEMQGQLYDKLHEIIVSRKEELKHDIEDLYQTFEGKTLKQKIAYKLSKSNIFMKIKFIENFVIKQAIALPPATNNKFGERVRKTEKLIPIYNKFLEIVEYKTKAEINKEMESRGNATIRIDENGNVIRYYSNLEEKLSNKCGFKETEQPREETYTR